MILKRFEDIEFSDLESLLRDQVAEGKTIEYKENIVSNADSDKNPFLAGVSAFANTIGGDFIIGIQANEGIPIKLSGVNFTSADDEILRLEQMLQNGLEPRLPSINIKNIQSPKGEEFILVRVGRSWITPHRVKSNDKFYGRNSKGKYPLDVSELRTAFMLSEQITERVKNFRLERAKKLISNDELPAELIRNGRMLLHLLPLSSFINPIQINISQVYNENSLGVIGSGWNRKINLDGVLSYTPPFENCEAYTQIFRNGCVESAYVFSSYNKEEKYIPSNHFESELIDFIKKGLKFFSDLEVEPPIYLFLTLIDVKDYGLAINTARIRDYEKRALDRNNLYFPEIEIDNYDTKAEDILRPVFDMVWNSYGFSKCFNYDENGERKH